MVVMYFQLWWDQKIWQIKSNLTLKVKVIANQNIKDLSQDIFHLWSKFGDPSLNR